MLEWRTFRIHGDPRSMGRMMGDKRDKMMRDVLWWGINKGWRLSGGKPKLVSMLWMSMLLHATDYELSELCSSCQDSKFRSFQGLEDGRSNKYTWFSKKHLIALIAMLWFFSQWIQRKAEFLGSSEWLLISSAWIGFVSVWRLLFKWWCLIETKHVV